LTETNPAESWAATSGSEKLSRAMTWHQWQVEYPIETITGTSRSVASANGPGPQARHSTGLSACDLR
jgi:hypothetical protein